MPKAKPYSFSFKNSPGMMLLLSYVVLFVVNAAVLWGSHWLFPVDIVFGTESITPAWAVLHSVGVITLITTFAIPVIHEIEKWKNMIFSPLHWTIAYALINFTAIWGVSRFAEQFGFGVRAWWIVLILAILMDIVQGIAMMLLEKNLAKK